MRVLVAGWYSFELMGATAGDLIARDLVCEWLSQAGIPYDIALATPFQGGIDWESVDPAAYTHLVFVCGPIGNGPPVDRMFERFSHCRMAGINLSMLQKLDEWNPFEFLWERDSDCASHPDVTFMADYPQIPVVGVLLAHKQQEYGDRALHDAANAAIDRLLASRELAVVPIDTCLDVKNAGGLRTPHEITTLMARMDAVVTTRLHGMVLALAQGVPALSIDPIAGGAKIKSQRDVIGWPVGFGAEDLDDAALVAALDRCLSEEGKLQAAACRDWARKLLSELPTRFIDAMQKT
ncbi:polysaccharide pyruvyl transferase family protein [Coraliomargarita parva]|uniref:polysaccharide pyruvyl transferase family protein n=1 Tax=Coraliomargarita parva TaxID=3014050 RepID=UPI0022B49096|nr:polysaccharide pyruvyl transferase family protein [Coraliomargarita parva]